jgi:hypothetical protein
VSVLEDGYVVVCENLKKVYSVKNVVTYALNGLNLRVRRGRWSP